MSALSCDVVEQILRTEKGTRLSAHRKYFFRVSRRSTKPQIRRAVEELFNVKVTHVRTAIMPGKPRRLGRSIGRRPRWKRAVVTLGPGQKIEVAD